ncbi:hypothetical protein BJ944DRAFT_244734 [Cunninghamella echinulata]|nr:hypothetical protein BJ944DRAFT_244734 [Cunninghamella echinulata]
MSGNRAQRRALQREQKKAAKKEAKRAMKLGQSSPSSSATELPLKKETPSVITTAYQQQQPMIKELIVKNTDHHNNDMSIITSSTSSLTTDHLMDIIKETTEKYNQRHYQENELSLDKIKEIVTTETQENGSSFNDSKEIASAEIQRDHQHYHQEYNDSQEKEDDDDEEILLTYNSETKTIHEYLMDGDDDHQSIIIIPLPSIKDNDRSTIDSFIHEQDELTFTSSINEQQQEEQEEEDDRLDKVENQQQPSEAASIEEELVCQVNVVQNGQLHQTETDDYFNSCDTNSTLKRSSYSSPNDTLNDLTTFASSHPTLLTKNQSSDTLVIKKKKKLSHLLDSLKKKNKSAATIDKITDKPTEKSTKNKKKWQFWKKNKKDNIVIKV